MTEPIDLPARLRTYVGREAEPPALARDEVNTAFIRAWCDAVGDRNPVYLDPAAAAASSHGRVIAPPPMIQSWFLPPVGAPLRTAGSTIAELSSILAEAGYSATVATNSEHRYLRDVVPGDRLTIHQSIESISDEKTTSLGTGFFISILMTVDAAAGDVVATLAYRRFQFKPRRR